MHASVCVVCVCVCVCACIRMCGARRCVHLKSHFPYAPPLFSHLLPQIECGEGLSTALSQLEQEKVILWWKLCGGSHDHWVEREC